MTKLNLSQGHKDGSAFEINQFNPSCQQANQKKKNHMIYQLMHKMHLTPKKKEKNKYAVGKITEKSIALGGGKIAVEDDNIFFKWGKKQNKVTDDDEKILFWGLAIRLVNIG